MLDVGIGKNSDVIGNVEIKEVIVKVETFRILSSFIILGPAVVCSIVLQLFNNGYCSGVNKGGLSLAKQQCRCENYPIGLKWPHQRICRHH